MRGRDPRSARGTRVWRVRRRARDETGTRRRPRVLERDAEFYQRRDRRPRVPNHPGHLPDETTDGARRRTRTRGDVLASRRDTNRRGGIVRASDAAKVSETNRPRRPRPRPRSDPPPPPRGSRRRARGAASPRKTSRGRRRTGRDRRETVQKRCAEYAGAHVPSRASPIAPGLGCGSNEQTHPRRRAATPSPRPRRVSTRRDARRASRTWRRARPRPRRTRRTRVTTGASRPGARRRFRRRGFVSRSRSRSRCRRPRGGSRAARWSLRVSARSSPSPPPSRSSSQSSSFVSAQSGVTEAVRRARVEVLRRVAAGARVNARNRHQSAFAPRVRASSARRGVRPGVVSPGPSIGVEGVHVSDADQRTNKGACPQRGAEGNDRDSTRSRGEHASEDVDGGADEAIVLGGGGRRAVGVGGRGTPRSGIDGVATTREDVEETLVEVLRGDLAAVVAKQAVERGDELSLCGERERGGGGERGRGGMSAREAVGRIARRRRLNFDGRVCRGAPGDARASVGPLVVSPVKTRTQPSVSRYLTVKASYTGAVTVTSSGGSSSVEPGAPVFRRSRREERLREAHLTTRRRGRRASRRGARRTFRGGRHRRRCRLARSHARPRVPRERGASRRPRWVAVTVCATADDENGTKVRIVGFDDACR